MDKKIEKIGILLPSYRRPIETRNAIFSALNQNYENIKVFVAIKGFSEDYINLLFKNAFAKEIEAGKLVLRTFPNKCQISNTLDCIRDEDISDIDYFIKMDNDDIYLENYVTNHVNFLRDEYEAENYPDGVGIHFAIDIKNSKNATWFFENHRNQVYGNQLAFSPKVVEILFQVERGDFQVLADLGINVDKYTNLMDDNLVCDIARALGGFLQRENNSDCFYNDYSSSCYRDSQNYLGVKRKNNNPSLKEALGMEGEEIIHVHHPYWSDYFIILGDRFSKMDGDGGKIVSRENGDLIVKWDRWGKEIFRKHKEGYYIFGGDIRIDVN